jgi:hypothetical protein
LRQGSLDRFSAENNAAGVRSAYKVVLTTKRWVLVVVLRVFFVLDVLKRLFFEGLFATG